MSDNNEKNNEDKEQQSQPITNNGGDENNNNGDTTTLETGILNKRMVARREMFRKQQNDNLDVLPPRHSLLVSTRNFKEAFNIDDISLSSDEGTAKMDEEDGVDEARFTFKKKPQGSSNRVLGNNSRPGITNSGSGIGRRHSETLPTIQKNKSMKGVDIEQASRPRHSFSFAPKISNSIRLLESGDTEKLKQRISLISSGNASSGTFDPEQPMKFHHENNSMFWTLAAILLVLFFILVGIGILYQLSKGNAL